MPENALGATILKIVKKAPKTLHKGFMVKSYGKGAEKLSTGFLEGL